MSPAYKSSTLRPELAEFRSQDLWPRPRLDSSAPGPATATLDWTPSLAPEDSDRLTSWLCPSTEPVDNWVAPANPVTLWIGRHEGTHEFLGR